MNNVIRVVPTISSFLFCVALQAQSTPPPLATTPLLTPAPVMGEMESRKGVTEPEAPTHFGMRFADFKEVNEALMRTSLEDPAIVEISKKIEALIAEREAMIFEAASKNYPKVAERIRAMQRNVEDLKRKKGEQEEKIRELGKDKSDKSGKSKD